LIKSIIEKQLLEWKEELNQQKQKQIQARKVLEETNQTILMLEGGIQATDLLLKKIEQESQQSNKEELKLQAKQEQSN
tara:strand:+ start:470 stop:703 length:234 start_codon:yes stop_codon:yes gene_type:complete